MKQDLNDTTTMVSVEVYLRSFEHEPDAEYVDGVIEERTVPEFDHAAWQNAINLWFLTHREQWGIRVMCELRVRVSSTRYRIPDVTVMDRAQPVEQIITQPPIAVFEVLSPGDRMASPAFIRKLEDYSSMKISQIWVIDTADGSAQRYKDGKLMLSERFYEPDYSIEFEFESVRTLLKSL